MRPLSFLLGAGLLPAVASAMTMAQAAGGLRTRLLGSSSLRVTEACLGTMTYGLQNTAAEAYAQLDFAVHERGVNFIDTAEMFVLPS